MSNKELLKEIQEQIEANSKILIDIESKVNQESQRLIGYSETCTKYKTEIQVLEKQKSKLLQEVEQVKSDLALMIQKTKEDINAEYQKLIKERGEVDRLQAENQEALKVIQKQQADLSLADKEFQKETRTREEELKRLASEIATQKSLLAEETARLAAFEKSLIEHNKTLEERAGNLTEWEADLINRKKIFDEKNAQLQEAIASVESREKRLAVLKETLDLEKAENVKKCQELGTLTLEIQGEYENLARIEKEQKNKEADIVRRGAELTTREKEITVKELRVTKLIRDKELDEKIKELSK